MPRTSRSASPEDMIRSLDRLRATIDELPERFPVPGNMPRDLFVSFLRGIAGGCGALVAVAIVIPIVVWFLRGVNWVPIVGDFLSSVAVEMQQARSRP